MKNKNKIIIAILVVLIILIAGVGIWLVVDNQKKYNENISESESKVAEKEKNDSESESKVTDEEKSEEDKSGNKEEKNVNEEEKTDNNKETNDSTISDNTTQKSLTGTYSNKSQTNDYYHDATITVTNQTNSSIDFKLTAVHGSDVDHVNFGEVSGIAKKTGKDTYQFEETVDGTMAKITFKFGEHQHQEYVTVTESYQDDINPYAGHNVHFAGDYEKKYNENINESESKVTEQEKSDTNQNINKEEKTNNNKENNNSTISNNTTQKSLTGTYSNKSETNDYYHDAKIIVTNQTNSSIEFSLTAVHGSDVDHVNFGEVSGIAKKTGEDTYQFEETVDGITAKITFKFGEHQHLEHVTVTESYQDDINPYAGHNVHFAGDYEKIS